ncbi:hypothetical protein Taro_004164 [Colocasia esculenta]|uniref:Glabrous enhancer-binding protein-like DBD domain-containing protein n=1 Tax=Colocasia esculenta TaxID=4460 RepID=A0A843TPB9_COLES|nr:hypothetical protein [Colocasia esculenta]
MLPPAAEAAAAAAATEDRPAAGAGAAFLGDEDELDDSEEDEEEVETDELDDEDVDDDEDDLDRKLPASSAVATAAVSVGVLNGSSPSTSSASYPAAATAASFKIPNPNGNPAAVMGNSNPTPSLNSAAGAIGAVQAIVVAGGEGALDGPDFKRQRIGAAPAAGGGAVTVAAEEKKPLAALEDSRRLFQRLFTDEDEITILQGFLDFNSQRSGAGANHAHHHDTGPFYDQIRTRLQLDFNKNQLVEKLRRLKKKYRNIMNKMSSGKDYAFKSPHDQATFELSRKIWGSSIYFRGGGAGPDDDDDDDPTPHPQMGGDDHGTLMGNSDRRRIRRRGRRRSIAAAAAASEALLMTPEAPVEVKVAESHMPSAMASVPNVIEETVRSCLSPLFKELLYCAVGGPVGPGANSGGLGGMGLSPLPLTVGNNPVNLPNAAAIDDKWRKQQILELEVYSKRIELVQEQVKLMLEELRKSRIVLVLPRGFFCFCLLPSLSHAGVIILAHETVVNAVLFLLSSKFSYWLRSPCELSICAIPPMLVSQHCDGYFFKLLKYVS